MRAKASGTMDLSSCTWMVRELGEAVSCVHLLDDNSILVGGWDGKVKCWSDEGDLIWESQTPNRVSSIIVKDNFVYTTSGLHLVCMTHDSGEIVWETALEGSADAVVATDECLLATSSVYDIEHNDFIESAVWAISFDGNVLETHRMDERPWTFHSYKHGAIAGLGRPMNGYLILDQKGGIVEQNTEWESPTICSTKGSTPLFGLANGSVYSIDGTLLKTMDAAVSNIIQQSGGLLLSDDRGYLEFYKEGVQWECKGDEIGNLCAGFDVQGNPSCWVARWKGSEGEVLVHSIIDGAVLASLDGPRVHDMTSNLHRVALGCDSGQVYVWEKKLFQRRLAQPMQQESDAARSAMLEKLRSLRK